MWSPCIETGLRQHTECLHGHNATSSAFALHEIRTLTLKSSDKVNQVFEERCTARFQVRVPGDAVVASLVYVHSNRQE